MPQIIPVSCFVITKNEADRVGRMLASIAGLVDDIVVVDSGSSDQTLAIAEAAGAKIYQHEWHGFGPQKRFAEEQCRHDWVLNLDADEVVTRALADEIRALFQHAMPHYSGYRFHQTMVYPGRSRPRLWADYHNYIRLYDRRVMRFSSSPTHDTVRANGIATGQLDNIALHHSWRSLAHLAEKYDQYTGLQAATLKEKPWPMLAVRLISEFPLLFFKAYVLHRHFTGGVHGLMVAGIIAWSRWRRITKMIGVKVRGSVSGANQLEKK